MSPENPTSLEKALDSYQMLWTEGVTRVLETIAGPGTSARPFKEASLEEDFERWASEGRWIRFGATGPISGEQAFLISRGSAEQLGQLRVDPETGSSAEDPLLHLIAGFASATAGRWKETRSEDVGFPILGGDPPGWTAAASLGFHLGIGDVPPLTISLKISPELAESLEGLSEVQQKPPKPEESSRTVPAPDLSSINVGLLSDIELPAFLRWGERELPLGDVMEFAPGFTIEVDQPTDHLAELVVAGTVVARGEVVIVDGNYGIRIKEVAAPHTRMSALEEDSRQAFLMLSRRFGRREVRPDPGS